MVVAVAALLDHWPLVVHIQRVLPLVSFRLSANGRDGKDQEHDDSKYPYFHNDDGTGVPRVLL